MLHRALSYLGLVSLLAAAPGSAQLRESWVRAFDAGGSDRAEDLALRPDGSVVALGGAHSSGSGTAALVVAYSPGGDLLWSREIFGGGGQVGGVRLAVAGDGSVFVVRRAGTGIETHKLAPGGLLEWSRTRPNPHVPHAQPPSLQVAADGSVFVATSDDQDYRVLRYSASGAELLDRAIDVRGGLDTSSDIALGSDGTVYVTGISYSATSHFAGYATYALDPAGVILWEAIDTGDINAVLGPAHVDIDPFGDVVVVGVPETVCGLFQFATWKYDAQGTTVWERAYPSQPCDSMEPRAMGIDSLGNIVITGGGFDLETIQYDPAGNLLWSQSLDGAASSTDWGVDLAIDPLGGVYVTGNASTVPLDFDQVSVRYSAGGAQRGLALYDSHSGGNNTAQRIVASGSGVVYALGTQWAPSTSDDIVVIRYDDPLRAER